MVTRAARPSDNQLNFDPVLTGIFVLQSEARVMQTVSIRASSSRAPSYAAAQAITAIVPPPFVSPLPTFCQGPKDADLVVSFYASRAVAGHAAPAVVFYRWGLEPLVGTRAYWEYVRASGTSTTLGGFGVGSNQTETGSLVGQGSNPGVALYYASGAYSVWNNGAQVVLAAGAVPTRIGVAVEVAAPDTLLVRWYADGMLLNPVAAIWTFDGPLWVPVLCSLAAGVVWTLEDSL
jgi:hypothetical protein